MSWRLDSDHKVSNILIILIALKMSQRRWHDDACYEMIEDAETCQHSPFSQTKSSGNFSQRLNENIHDEERLWRVGSMFERMDRKQ